MFRRRTVSFLFIIASLAFAGCGKKANPQPPDESSYRGRPLKTAIASGESRGVFTEDMIEKEDNLRRPS